MSAVERRVAVVRTRQGAAHHIRAFYARPIAWVALIVTSVLLAYGGGAVMFWFHAVLRKEKGPPINNWYHWLFDSSLGFVVLTPALALIMPAALAAVSRARHRSEAAKATLYVLLVGVLFGITTGPGPFLHDLLAGRGKPLARLAVNIFGYNAGVAAATAHVREHWIGAECLLQILVGVPVYSVIGLLALAIVRTIASRSWRI